MSEVIVYSTTTCPFCVMVKDWLKTKGVAFDDINVGTDKEKAAEMIKKSGQMGVPVVDVGGEIIIGFDQKRIEEALKKNNLLK